MRCELLRGDVGGSSKTGWVAGTAEPSPAGLRPPCPCSPPSSPSLLAVLAATGTCVRKEDCLLYTSDAADDM
eukprot:1373070-Rhodomonas_salina.2